MNFERKNFNLVLIRSYKYHISVVQYLHPAHSGLGAKFLYMCFFLHIRKRIIASTVSNASFYEIIPL